MRIDRLASTLGGDGGVELRRKSIARCVSIHESFATMRAREQSDSGELILRGNYVWRDAVRRAVLEERDRRQ